MRLSAGLVVAIVLTLVALAALAPATLVDRRLAAATDGRFRIASAGGTVWRGRGALTDARGTWQLPVAWHASPLALARGALALDFGPVPDSGAVQGQLLLTGSGAELRNLRALIPAQALASFAPDNVVGTLAGAIAVDAPALRYDGGTVEGAADFRWDRARVAINGSAVDLGTVTVRIAPRGQDLAGTLANTGGALGVAGDERGGAGGGLIGRRRAMRRERCRCCRGCRGRRARAQCPAAWRVPESA